MTFGLNWLSGNTYAESLDMYLARAFYTICSLRNQFLRSGKMTSGASSSDLGELDELNMAIATDAGGEERRNQLLVYLLEVRG
ncbi:hypothetical protein GN958_ATG08078 [Phytophthora infestans]|uniref:Uncharacterized protein n=1 Tax=Phytophthora infestans TaxID=4787 RepID=A0A8S9UPH5_PHYIN|nr:hypothetical protein GN958_ATG08078 [Phytophthora infestans]